jgi:hypothetical protein
MALHRQTLVSKVHQTPQSLRDQLIDLSGVLWELKLTRNIQSRLHLPDIRMYRGRLARQPHVATPARLEVLTLKIRYTCFTIWTTDTRIRVGSSSGLCRPPSLGDI